MHYLLKKWKLRAFIILAGAFVLGGILLVEGVPTVLNQWYTGTVSDNEKESSEERLSEAAVLTAAVAKEIPTVEQLRQYPHNWDENPFAYLPEASR